MPAVPENVNPTKAELSSLAHTLAHSTHGSDEMRSRLEYISELLDDARNLPAEPILVWRTDERVVTCATIGSQLLVGRHSASCDVALPNDKRLSSVHFIVRRSGSGFELEDQESRNGTAINQPEARVKQEQLRDGDLIFAGKQIFVFLDQGRRD